MGETTPGTRSGTRARLRRRWVVREQRPAVAEALAASGRFPAPVARLLAARGWCEGAELDTYLLPKLADTLDPHELNGMEAAVARVRAALAARESIAVHGDYDADGLCATAILARTLRWLGADPVLAIPHRLNEGYGMARVTVDRLAASGVKLIVTVDTGISAVPEIAHARALGMDVIVTDHHLPGDDLPDAVAIVNPNLPGAIYAGGRLCGAGVAFKLAHALIRAERPGSADGRAFVRSLLDLVAVATVADVVPLLGENRTFVRHGLDGIATTSFAGVRALMKVLGGKGGAITSDTVGFGLAPRLNAAGRTEGDALIALSLLMTDDDGEAAEIAERLDAMNKKRRAIEADILAKCLELMDAAPADGMSSIVLAAQGWHLGVVGTVASRLCERYHRPAVVLGIEGDVAKGSARSIRGYDVHDGLHRCREHLLTWGGHAGAAGLRLEVSRVGEFRAALEAHAREMIAPESLEPFIDVDTEIAAKEIDWNLLAGVQSMQPFGEANKAPVFMLRGAVAAVPPRIVGTDHLKLAFRVGARNIAAIGFSLGTQIESWRTGQPHDVLFRPVENHYMGDRSLEMEMVDTRVSA